MSCRRASVAVDVMHIVGGDVFGVVAFAEVDQGFVERGQFGNVVALQFDEEIIRAEDVVVPIQHLAAGFDALVQNGARHFARHARGGGDQPFRVCGQEFMIHTGIVVETLPTGRRWRS